MMNSYALVDLRARVEELEELAVDLKNDLWEAGQVQAYDALADAQRSLGNALDGLGDEQDSMVGTAADRNR